MKRHRKKRNVWKPKSKMGQPKKVWNDTAKNNVWTTIINDMNRMQDKISTGGDWTSRLKQWLYQLWEEFFKWFQKADSFYSEIVIAIAVKNCFNFLKTKNIMEWITETYFIKKWTINWTRNFFELISYEKQKHKLNSEFLKTVKNEPQFGLGISSS